MLLYSEQFELSSWLSDARSARVSSCSSPWTDQLGLADWLMPSQRLSGMFDLVGLDRYFQLIMTLLIDN
jgi:hypothetical protein